MKNLKKLLFMSFPSGVALYKKHMRNSAEVYSISAAQPLNPILFPPLQQIKHWYSVCWADHLCILTWCLGQGGSGEGGWIQSKCKTNPEQDSTLTETEE